MNCVTPFFHEATSSLSYLVRDPGSKSCAIIDPVMDYDPADHEPHGFDRG